jgi:Carboxypeptidase regulatory-like domain
MLVRDYDDELPWQAVQKLRLYSNREVFERVAEWCRSHAALDVTNPKLFLAKAAYNPAMIVLIVALLVMASPQETQNGPAAIEGVVTRAGSLQPVWNARVAIWGDSGPDFETKTDANGRYVFSNLPPGIFNIEVEAEGYLTVPNPSSSDRIRLTVVNGQRVRRDIALSATSKLSGRILDANRDPIGGIAVEILTLAQDRTERRAWRVVKTATTDAKGEYRVEGLPADDYYVRAAQKPSASLLVRLNSEDVIKTYFPGTLDAPTAAAIPLRDGGEQYAEFSLAGGRTYTVTGTITNSDSPTVPSVRLYAIPQDARIPLDSVATAGISVVGDFQLKGLLPGLYDLFAVAFATHQVVYGDAGVREVDKTDAPMRLAKTPIEIRDADVRDVRLILDPPADVKGRIRIMGSNGQSVVLESNQDPLAPINLKTGSTTIQIRLGLTRNQDFVDGIVIPRLGSVAGDSFVFSGVPAGVYDVSISELGSDKIYVADVREDGRSVFDEGLEVRSQPIDSLEVFLGFDGGAIEGAVVAAKKSPVLVVLAPPISRRKNRTLYKTVTLTDTSKSFRFSNVAPGLYSLFAFELGTDKDNVPYLSQDYLSLYTQQAVSVIAESGSIVVSRPVSLITR